MKNESISLRSKNQDKGQHYIKLDDTSISLLFKFQQQGQKQEDKASFRWSKMNKTEKRKTNKRWTKNI